jgi:hypothetical protein
MGYELHITLAPPWRASSDYPISNHAWRHLIANDTSLSVSETEHYTRKDPVLGSVRIPAVLWSNDPDVAFWFDRGEIQVKNPSDATILKMLEIASKLDARLIGDDDEEYFTSLIDPGFEFRQPPFYEE